MRELMFFLVGLALGAVTGLMFAPKSGQQLRGDIQQRANEDIQKLQKTYDQKVQDLNQKVEQLQAQMKKEQQSGAEAVQDVTDSQTASA